MNREEAWKNFDLGDELAVSGTFIYNGLRCFHEMRTLDQPEEVFEFFYNLSVGFERVLKIAVVLLEHDGTQDQIAFEKTLITHTHLDLLKRVKAHSKVTLGSPHNEFLGMLGKFYKTSRYNRFSLSQSSVPAREKEMLQGILAKHLGVPHVESTPLSPFRNEDRFKKYIGKLVGKISGELYEIVRKKASSLNLYTYELRIDSKASKVFQKNDCTFASEEVLWKELLIFFMNTRESSGLMEFLKSIRPLDFDVGLAYDYLQCFQSEEGKQSVLDELETHYSDLENVAERLETMGLIGNPNVSFEVDPAPEGEGPDVPEDEIQRFEE